MEKVITNFGELTGTDFRTYFSNGKVDGALMKEANTLKTAYGEFVPQYEAEDMGRRAVKPVYFYKNGNLKSLPLQEQSVVKTSVGDMPAELITFYKSGAIKRLFPLDGKLSGFWSWKNEFQMAKAIDINTPLGHISAKVISAFFYESGALKSLTFWPGEVINLNTTFGETAVRIGVSFYEDGRLRSFEPAKAIDVETPIGALAAYDSKPLGVHGDINSLEIGEKGQLLSISTVTDEIKVIDKNNNRYIYKPLLKDALCGKEGSKETLPLKMKFDGDCVVFHHDPKHTFCLPDCQFEIHRNQLDAKSAAEPAESCSA
ncbi:conserved hypothetical protein [Chloroherpeton thalassium ATCC 35110]|uniref:Uncharacterized protein n=1 Tax=Chloroherpeton thalassium (strain ATCC 35110 / GB-78) TaxID=517418 RepID=B3QWY7_CHLT3|nr:hypothetical protein [Chloroherpeton thalassium]ACF13351.1 conserved hypothetical protein [Chloroherpeton thalassium ATCC 35110]